jgi:hypothetical protein
LEHGVKVWRGYDAKHKRSLIHFEIVGAKVKARQGQPVRHIAYAEEDGHPLVAMLNSSLSATEDASLTVKIEKALNFTVEVRRPERAIRRAGPRHPAIRPDEVEPAP